MSVKDVEKNTYDRNIVIRNIFVDSISYETSIPPRIDVVLKIA